MRDALARSLGSIGFRSKSFHPPVEGETPVFMLFQIEQYPRENATLPGACRPSRNCSCVASTRASMPPAVCWQKGADIPAGLPFPTYRRAGTRLARRAIVARTPCAAAPRLRRFRATPHTPFSPFSVPSKRRRSTDSLSTSDPLLPVAKVHFKGGGHTRALGTAAGLKR
jgi:hypothetical protein